MTAFSTNVIIILKFEILIPLRGRCYPVIISVFQQTGWEAELNCFLQGIEKKTAKLQGSEKAVVARHEAGHAVVGTAVANLLPGQPRVEVGQ